MDDEAWLDAMCDPLVDFIHQRTGEKKAGVDGINTSLTEVPRRAKKAAAKHNMERC